MWVLRRAEARRVVHRRCYHLYEEYKTQLIQDRPFLFFSVTGCCLPEEYLRVCALAHTYRRP
jgi:hypothetical protein